jgi:hypothetical protein
MTGTHPEIAGGRGAGRFRKMAHRTGRDDIIEDLLAWAHAQKLRNIAEPTPRSINAFERYRDHTLDQLRDLQSTMQRVRDDAQENAAATVQAFIGELLNDLEVVIDARHSPQLQRELEEAGKQRLKSAYESGWHFAKLRDGLPLNPSYNPYLPNTPLHQAFAAGYAAAKADC